MEILAAHWPSLARHWPVNGYRYKSLRHARGFGNQWTLSRTESSSSRCATGRRGETREPNGRPAGISARAADRDRRPPRDTTMASSSARTAYLNDTLFPRAVADGAFGAGAVYESFAADDGRPAPVDQFASDIAYGTVTWRDGGRQTRRLAVVVKFKNADAAACAAMNAHQKFHNERVFYGRLLPELARRSADPAAALALFPRFVYSNATADGRTAAVDGGDGGEQVIVVENASPHGYRASDQRVSLDADHVTLALRMLGTLHGLSYAAKAHADGPDAFVRLTGALAETQWFDGHWYKSPRFLPGVGYRGVNALLESDAAGEYADGRLDRMRAMLDGGSDTMAELLRPAEPLAVLCHGDFCRNNVLFRYDAATGRPVAAIMLDPAQARYASPAVDLSFFLYMNAADADRLHRWDDYAAAYVAGAADVCARPPTVADVHAEMRARGLYGYAHCSFFLPAMVDARPPDVRALTACTDDERVRAINASGGRTADRLLASVVKLMLDRGYV